ncbi:MAG: cyclic lactone autoinducer peptide [bacterium]
MKNGQKNVKMKALDLVSKIAMQEARQSANTSCVVLAHQDKLPEAVKSLRKF